MTMTIEGVGGSFAGAGRPEAIEEAGEAGGYDRMRELIRRSDRSAEIQGDIAELMAMLRAGTLDAGTILAMCERRIDGLDGQIQDIMEQLEGTNSEATRIGGQMADLRELQEWLRDNTTTSGSGWADPRVPGEAYALTEENVRAWLEASGMDPVVVDEATLRSMGLDDADIHAILNEDAIDIGALRARVAEERPFTDGEVGLLALDRTPTRDEAKETLRSMGFSDDEIDRVLADLPRPPPPQATVRAYLNLNGHSGMRGPSDIDAALSGLNEELSRQNSGNEMLMIRLQSLMQARTSVIQMSSNLLKALDETTDTTVGNLR